MKRGRLAIALAVASVASSMGIGCHNSADQAPHNVAEVPIDHSNDGAASSNDIPHVNMLSSIDDSEWNFCGEDTIVHFNFGGTVLFDDSAAGRKRMVCRTGTWSASGERGKHITFDCNGVSFWDVDLTGPNKLVGTARDADVNKFPPCLDRR